MPEIGEVRSAKELGKKSDSSAYVYQPCPCCGLNPRWVRRPKAHRICVKCARKMMLDDKESGLTDKLISNGLARMSKNGRIEYKHTCRVCGKDGLWDQKRDIDRTCSLKCAHSVRLSGDKSPKWNGGRRITMGYSDIMIYSDNPFYAMSHDSGHGCHYIPEHRLVMAQHLGRCLESWEIVIIRIVIDRIIVSITWNYFPIRVHTYPVLYCRQN